jgi:tRNA ligase
MVADRNNHQRRERQQLIEDISRIVPNARFVALHFVHDRGNFDHIRQELRQRVLSRGDNHQTIHTSKGPGEIIGIMEGFLQRFEPCNSQAPPDDAFDMVIDLDPTADSRHNLEAVIAKLYTGFPKLFAGREMPSSEDMDLAIRAALDDYTVDIKHEIKGFDNKKKDKQPSASAKKLEYFCVQVPASDINSILDAMFANHPRETPTLYHMLKHLGRIQDEFHVTLIHRANAAEHQETWNHLADLHARAAASTLGSTPDLTLGLCRVRLEHLVWDDRVMAFVVRLIPVDDKSEQFQSTNALPHITVGTARPDIKPKESNDLLARWLREGSGQNGIQQLPVQGNVELGGTVKAVLSR